MALFLRSDPKISGRTLTEDELRTRVQVMASDAADRVMTVYREAHPQASPAERYILMTTDRTYWFDSITLAQRKHAYGRAPVYMYQFAWETPAQGGKLLAHHALELTFVFDNTSKVAGPSGGGPGGGGAGRKNERGVDRVCASRQSSNTEASRLARVHDERARDDDLQQRMPRRAGPLRKCSSLVGDRVVHRSRLRAEARRRASPKLANENLRAEAGERRGRRVCKTLICVRSALCGFRRRSVAQPHLVGASRQAATKRPVTTVARTASSGHSARNSPVSAPSAGRR